MSLADSHRSPLAPILPFPRESVFDVTPLIDALEEQQGRTREILATLGVAEGPWVGALRDLSSACAGERSRGREVAHASWRQVWEVGEVWEAPRLGRAVEQLRRAYSEDAACEFIDDLHDALALVHWVALVENPLGLAEILSGLEDDPASEAVLRALASLGDFTEEVVDRTWDQLAEGEKTSACRLLSRTQGAWGAARLIEGLDARETRVRVAAARALASRPESDALGELVRRLEQAVGDEDPSADREIEALGEAIVAMAAGSDEQSEQVIATLSEWALTSEESVRIGFAKVLVEVAGPRGSKRVDSILDDPSPNVREVAASALLALRGEHAVTLRDRLLADEADRVRMAAAVSLGAGWDGAGFDGLERLLYDDCEGVRTAAFRSLAMRLARDPSGVDGDRGLAWLDEGIRRGGLSAIAAVELLFHLPGSPADARVVELLARSVPEVACAVLAVLRRESEPSRAAAVAKALDHPDASVRVEAAHVLVDLKQPRARAAILSRVESERDPSTRSALMAVARRLER